MGRDVKVTINPGQYELAHPELSEKAQIILNVINQKKSKHKDFHMASNKEMIHFFTTNSLSGLEYRTLGLMICLMDWDNVVRYSQTELSMMLSSKPVVIGRAIKKLKETGLVAEAQRVGRVIFFQVNPHYAYKTKVKECRKLREEWDRRTALTG